MARSAGRPTLGLELADMRAGREGTLPSPTHDDRPNLAGLGRLERRQCGTKLDEKLLRDEVERRIDQLDPYGGTAVIRLEAIVIDDRDPATGLNLYASDGRYFVRLE